MSKRSDEFYFGNFVAGAQIACDAAYMMRDIIADFHADTLIEKRVLMHEIEHKGDEKKHEMTAALVKAFITPIERDDIFKLSQNIDDVIDSIEDIIIHIYINGIKEIRPDSLAFADVIIKCCETMRDMLCEFSDFKKSKRMRSLIIEINRLEEEGDKLYMETMRKLHAEETDPIKVIAWRELYEYFEKCCDTCEDVADIVEGITIGNT